MRLSWFKFLEQFWVVITAPTMARYSTQSHSNASAQSPKVGSKLVTFASKIQNKQLSTK